MDGLYKVEYGVGDAFGRSIMCMHDGNMLGGNSAFAHLGTYHQSGDEVAAEIITERHNEDPHYKPLMGIDVAAIKRTTAASTPRSSPSAIMTIPITSR